MGDEITDAFNAYSVPAVEVIDPDGILNREPLHEDTAGRQTDGDGPSSLPPPPVSFITMEEARLACRIDGTANDEIIRPIKEMAEAYVCDVVGKDRVNDPRARQAALTMIQIVYRPEEDAQGNLKAHMISLLRQMCTYI